jgi:maltose alpha-D-glucosyltransferase/alpha-amylase
VPYLYEREGTTCENLEETHEYLKRMRAMVDTDYPGRILLAEANQWPVDLLPYLENNDEFQMAFNFPIMPRLYMGLRRQNRQDIVDILNQTPPIPYETQWCIFLRNHDELTLEMVTVEQREWMWNEYAPEPRMRINLGIRRRLAPLLDNDVRKINLLNALLFSLPGTPIVYYGDEIGMGDNIWLDDRNGVRTPMQWNGSFNGGFSEAEDTYLPVIDDPIYGYRTVNVERLRENEDSLWHSVCWQINLRREHTVFGRGDFRTLEPNNPSIFAFIRWLTDREDPEEVSGVEQIIVLANLSDEPQDVDIDATDYLGQTPVDLLTGNPYKTIETERYTFGLNPYACLWLALK